MNTNETQVPYAAYAPTHSGTPTSSEFVVTSKFPFKSLFIILVLIACIIGMVVFTKKSKNNQKNKQEQEK